MAISYDDRLYQILKILEGYKAVLYTDDQGIVTTSIGVSLQTYHDEFMNLIESDPRYHFSPTSAAALEKFIEKNEPASINDLSTLLAQRNIIPTGTKLTLKDAEIRDLYNDALPKEEAKEVASTPNVTDQSQLISLISLAYNGLLTKSPNLIKDVNKEDWADAWFEIRYDSNPNALSGPITKKRLASRVADTMRVSFSEYMVQRPLMF